MLKPGGDFSMQRKYIELARFVDPDLDIMEIASQAVVTCREDDRLREVIEVMLERFRRLPVIDREENCKGIVTTTDILSYLGGGEKYELFVKNQKSLNIHISKLTSKRVYTLDKKTSIKKTLELFKTQRRGAYPIVYRKKLVGIVAEWDFVKQINEFVGIKVQDLMIRKPLVIKENYSVLDVAKIICRGGFRRLPIAKSNTLIGIVTPYDLLSYLSKERKLTRLELEHTPVKKIMNRDVTTIGPKFDIFDATQIIINKKIGGIVVTEGKELVGILTERDIVDSLI